jgi:DnaJ-class molecular chaperone
MRPEQREENAIRERSYELHPDLTVKPAHNTAISAEYQRELARNCGVIADGEFRAAYRQVGDDAVDRHAAGNIELSERMHLVTRIFAQILWLKLAHAAPRPD